MLRSNPLGGDSGSGQPKFAQDDIPSISQSDHAVEPAASNMPVVEGYQLLNPLGEGGMGVVWRATQLGTGRHVALKVIRPEYFDSASARARFEREIRLTAGLEHPFIVRLYDGGLHRGVYYYAMELVDGRHLDHHVQQVGASPRQIAHLMQTICEGVGYAHARGVIHRDLKPSNILVDQQGRPRVADFGLANRMGDEPVDSAAAARSVIGTPDYLAPELRDSETHAGVGSDVYALGAILFRLLTGRKLADRAVQTWTPAELKSIPASLRAIADRATAQSPSERFSTAVAMAHALGESLAAMELKSPARASRTLRRFLIAAVCLAALGGGSALWHYATVAMHAPLKSPSPPPPMARLTVSSPADGGPGSLRQAILTANQMGRPVTIEFHIPSDEPAQSFGGLLIQPLTALPPLTAASVTIDGTTAGGAGDSGSMVTIDGSQVKGEASGLVLTGPDQHLRGLHIVHFTSKSGIAAGILIDGPSALRDSIQASSIGTDRYGAAAGANDRGIWIRRGACETVVGGTTRDDTNVISWNLHDGILIEGTGTRGNRIEGNFIGAGAHGTEHIGNKDNGICIRAGASDNVVGGTAAGCRNYIIRNFAAGILIQGAATTANLVQGNSIGLGVDRSVCGNQHQGVFISDSPGNTISDDVITGNGIAAPYEPGVAIVGASASGNTVCHNHIGTDDIGTTEIGNMGDGVFVSGHENSISDNLISGNGAFEASNGVSLSGPGNVVRDNLIGADHGGLAILGNRLNGIWVNCNGNFITQNIIADNAGSGVLLTADADTTSILGNSIYSNSGGAIQFQGRIPPAPTLGQCDGSKVSGALQGDPRSSYVLEFFVSPSSGPRSYGPGRTFRASLAVGTDTTGRATFVASLHPPAEPGEFVAATATSLAKNQTSPFCGAIVASGTVASGPLQIDAAFTAGRSQLQSGPAVVGSVGDVWNRIDGPYRAHDAHGRDLSLLDVRGRPTPVRLSYSAFDHFQALRTNQFIESGCYNLFCSYLIASVHVPGKKPATAPLSAAGPDDYDEKMALPGKMSLSGLRCGESYDLYLYSAGTVSFGKRDTVFHLNGESAMASFSDYDQKLEEGANYVHFTTRATPAGTLDVEFDSTGEADLNGFQLVEK